MKMTRWSFISKVYKAKKASTGLTLSELIHDGGRARTVIREDGSMGHTQWNTKDLCEHNNRKAKIKREVKIWNPKKNRAQRRKYIALQSTNSVTT